MNEAERSEFVISHTRVLPAPLCPSIRLHLADQVTPLWQLTQQKLDQLDLPPPFWAFCWAGGAGVARAILDQPELVRGKRVIDVACGGGVIAIAATQAGASHVLAVDLDAFAITAAQLNARLNAVSIGLQTADVAGMSAEAFDVVLAGDVFYDKGMSASLLPWLEAQARAGKLVVIGDPHRAYRPTANVTLLREYDVPTLSDVEDAAIKRTAVWQLAAPDSGA